jgi:hypothetical protein
VVTAALAWTVPMVLGNLFGPPPATKERIFAAETGGRIREAGWKGGGFGTCYSASVRNYGSDVAGLCVRKRDRDGKVPPQVLDPCYVSRPLGVYLCFDSPWDSATVAAWGIERIGTERALPKAIRSELPSRKDAPPWGLELENEQRCLYTPVPRLYAGVPPPRGVTYMCAEDHNAIALNTADGWVIGKPTLLDGVDRKVLMVTYRSVTSTQTSSVRVETSWR